MFIKLSTLLATLFFTVVDLDRPVVLSDQDRFAHYSAQLARTFYNASLAHWTIVRDNPLYPEAWQEDAFWCYDCWNELDNLKNFSTTDERKIAVLRNLKRLLGPEMWKAGLMPPHVPFWWFWENK